LAVVGEPLGQEVDNSLAALLDSDSRASAIDNMAKGKCGQAHEDTHGRLRKISRPSISCTGPFLHSLIARMSLTMSETNSNHRSPVISNFIDMIDHLPASPGAGILPAPAHHVDNAPAVVGSPGQQSPDLPPRNVFTFSMSFGSISNDAS
jgi:hypothetical protein